MIMSNNDKSCDKVKKLEIATNHANAAMLEAKIALDEATVRLNNAKHLLRQLDSEEQQKIEVNDTMLPELLELQLVAKTRYDEAKARYDTNLKYLHLYKQKLKKNCSNNTGL